MAELFNVYDPIILGRKYFGYDYKSHIYASLITESLFFS